MHRPVLYVLTKTTKQSLHLEDGTSISADIYMVQSARMMIQINKEPLWRSKIVYLYNCYEKLPELFWTGCSMRYPSLYSNHDSCSLKLYFVAPQYKVKLSPSTTVSGLPHILRPLSSGKSGKKKKKSQQGEYYHQKSSTQDSEIRNWITRIYLCVLL